MDFSLNTLIEPPTVMVTASGELDIFTARDLSRQLDVALALGCRHVLVDVGSVSFVDASALGVLVRTRAAVEAADGTLQFVATSPAFRRLCSLTGLDVIFDITGCDRRLSRRTTAV